MDKRTVTTSHTLRGAAVFAVVVVLSVVWVVFRTVERAQVSNQWVVHTQEVLTTIETVLSAAVDAESAVRGYVPSSSDARALDPLERAERTAAADVNQLATLIADNPNQQAHVPELRQAMARTLAALRIMADAKRAARTLQSGRHRC